MWKTICTADEILKFMEAVCYFHDSCIKEMSYITLAEKHTFSAMQDCQSTAYRFLFEYWTVRSRSTSV